jgi:protein-disulfide isomerase
LTQEDLFTKLSCIAKMAAKKTNTNFLEKLTPILLLSTIGLAFVVGNLWEKVNRLESGNVVAGQNSDTTGQAAAQPEAVTVSIDNIKALFDKDLVKFGDKNSKVLFVEVADPSCPYCHIAAGYNPELNAQAGDRFKLVSDGGTYVAPVIEMKKLVDEGKASFVFIYSPGHGNGEMGTKAMYCAHEQGKFWEVHNALMTNEAYNLLNNSVKNDKTKSGELAQFLASEIDQNFLKSCLDSGKYDGRIREDVAAAQSLGVRGTPGFFVNDRNFAGAYNYKDMEPIVTQALN